MNKAGKLFIVLALVVVLGLPFLLQKSEKVTRFADDTVVIITPHTESIRYEFARAFEKWYQQKTGRSIYVDYRVIGGTSEIGKFLNSEFTNSFRNHWENDLQQEWTQAVQAAFANPYTMPDSTPGDDTPAEAARRAFLASGASSGIDLFFGGGAYDFRKQANIGNLVDAGLLRSRPDWFQETVIPGAIPKAIPESISGESFYDGEGRWYGTVLSSYGIIYNRDALARLEIPNEPRQWVDLTDPRYFGQIAVSDPTKSGSMAQAFEMIIQQQMHLLEGQGNRDEHEVVREGWIRGMQVVQKIAANARYFTDTSQKPNIDVATGDCAAGMSIDFYGRFQQENILDRSGDTRFGFHVPVGGTTVSADPIGLLRGARNKEQAILFIEFVLSLEGQKLWNFKVGEPGGPELFSLRRPPIRPELYGPEWNQKRSDASFNPYVAARDFTYRGDWTGRLFSEIRTIIRICFIDVRKELVEAWAAIIKAKNAGRLADAEEAERIMQDMTPISYEEAETTIDAVLKAPRIEEVRLARELSEHFREQYKRARRIAEGR
ncbi:ABC transporter substrate-binding protein [Puniceicoccales bacterium CK1056]|uniref:ABC transporter substrate-binding protein n=1 Tax=Oceanipulchritudo coccoides TaxID=2706888 RepID=A0A6B2M3P2_9BACT|nr:ABC transporter substrate-binding protein [Oceanipulchritudo coccoides]NDV62435.1 ABC transporter substrate-binding protein [Oceanipulchritudo coccoides]